MNLVPLFREYVFSVLLICIISDGVYGAVAGICTFFV